MEDYIQKMKIIREERGVGLDVLSEEIGIAEPLLRMIEIGEMEPTQKMLDKIIQFVLDAI